MSYDLKNPPYQLKTLIHHVLHRHHIYQLELAQLKQILQLLQQTTNETPLDIQHKIFIGILAFHQQYRDKVAPYLSAPIFGHISMEVKSMMHKVLHEFSFLFSIKAQEMFLSQYQQQGHNDSLLFDDQMERSRVHYMYYGPMGGYQHMGSNIGNMGSMNGISMGNMNSMAQINTMSNPPQQHSYMDNYQLQGAMQSIPPAQMPQHQSSQPQPHSQPLPQPLPQSLPQQIPVYGYGGLDRRIDYEPPIRPRGRPPKNRDPNATKNSQQTSKNKQKTEKNQSREIKLPESLRSDQSLSQYKPPQNQQIIQEKVYPTSSLQNCLCKGNSHSQSIFRCKCQQTYHTECVGSNKMCLTCRQMNYDPFWKVIQNAGSFPVSFENDQGRVDLEVNMARYWNDCRGQGCEVMVSCAHPKEEGICWPDDIICKINGNPVFEVPALFAAHHITKRADTPFIITPFIETQSSLLRMSLSFEVRRHQLLPERRNNRKGLFVVCLFVVKKVNPEDIFKEVLQQNTKMLKIRPFQWHFIGQVQPDRQQITLNDPYSGELIDYPVRGSGCRHLQCFDLMTFLRLTHSSATRLWRCPYCQKEAQKLLLDKFQLQMIEKLRKRDSIPKRIVFFSDSHVDYQYAETEELQREQKIKPQ